MHHQRKTQLTVVSHCAWYGLCRKSSRKNILGSQLGSQFAPPKSEDMLKGNVIPEFCGIRVRMGVHTAPVDKVSRHPVTNRVMYPNEFVRHTTMISDTPCGGQVVMSSQTLAETEPDSGSWFIMHLGAHILEEPLTEEQKSEFRSMRKSVHIGASVQSPYVLGGMDAAECRMTYLCCSWGSTCISACNTMHRDGHAGFFMFC